MNLDPTYSHISTSFLDYLAWRRAALRIRSYDRYLQYLAVIHKGLAKEEVLRVFPELIESYEQVSAADEQRRFLEYLEKGYRFLPPNHLLFPKALNLIPDPPRGLFVWGQQQALHRPMLAVVGSREPSQISLEWMEQTLRGFLLKMPEAVLVSGGARGIDQAAHRIAIRSGQPTVVFLPSGFDRLYPSQLRSWTDSILANGGVFVTEYAPEMEMRKSYFSERNRLISGISAATLIVEAKERSGTWLTARAAAEQGRPLFVVPAHPLENSFRGNLLLLSEGATPVMDAQELVSFFKAEVRFPYSSLKLSSTGSLEI